MPEKHLHIVTHAVPFPADIGGVIDIFYKIKALYKLGINIHLHCFTYNDSEPHAQLNRYCNTINYYPRKTGTRGISFRLPYIVSSRKNDALIKNLQKDNYPVLLEGVHSTYYFNNGELKDRKIAVRLFNTEFEYYYHLSIYECNPVKRFYYRYESMLLKRYEQNLAKKAFIIALSQQDVNTYRQLFNARDIRYLPAFLPYSLAICKEGKDCCNCLYHGNLSINENEKAVEWLLQNVFNELDIPFIIAGKNPSEKLKYLVSQSRHSCLVENPDDKEMQDLIAKSHINILPSFNNTGLKLKLLNALFNGKHCVVNDAAVEGTGLQDICHIANEPAEFKSLIRHLYKQPFSEEEIQQRQGLLQRLYNNEANAKQLISWLW